VAKDDPGNISKKRSRLKKNEKGMLTFKKLNLFVAHECFEVVNEAKRNEVCAFVSKKFTQTKWIAIRVENIKKLKLKVL